MADLNNNDPKNRGTKSESEIWDDEKDLVLDHNYDGIRELDNHMPRWWVLGFYFTIAFAVVYMVYYHVTDYGPDSDEEYQIEMAYAAEIYKNAESKKVDDSPMDYTVLTDAASLEKGKETYMSICFACHGGNGEGLVGPNLTDEYWIYGCDMEALAKSVKEGFPAKGMPAYGGGKVLSNVEIQQLASYVKSLEGTNPANSKPADMDRATICE